MRGAWPVESAPETDSDIERLAEAPPLLDSEGRPLGQTRARPSTATRWFSYQGSELFAAIVQDDAQRALAIFLPQSVYAQIKAIEDPTRDWVQRLAALLTRDVHTYHRRLGRERQQAVFSRIEVNEAAVKWVDPGEEGNRVGYYRALRSVLYYWDAAGRERELGVTAFISWRGEWYLVHLDGVK